MARSRYLSLNPKGGSPREVALAINEAQRGRINVVDEISIPMDQAEGVVLFDDNLVHFESGIFLAPKNDNARLMLPRLYVSDVDDKNYALFLEGDSGIYDIALLGGPTNSLTLNTSIKKVVGYTNSYDGGSMEGAANPVTGNITFPEDGLYRVTMLIVGEHANTVQNENAMMALRLWNGTVNTDIFVCVTDIATNKTSDRSFIATFTRLFTGGHWISIALVASTNLGTFTIPTSSFEVEKLTGVDAGDPEGDAEFLVLAIG